MSDDPLRSQNPLSSKETIRFSRHGGDRGWELLEADYPSHVFAPHTHDGYLIATITRGALEILDESGSHLARTGQVVLCNPNWIHWGRAADPSGWGISTIYVPQDRTLSPPGTDGPVCAGFQFARVVVDDPVLSLLVRRAVALRNGLSEAGPLTAALENAFAIAVARHAIASVPGFSAVVESEAVGAARKFIDRHFLGAMSLDMLSEVGSLNKFTLLKSFKKQWGVTPLGYQKIKRVEYARQCLRQGASLLDVAFDSGFADQSHFSREFKRSTGITPGRFACQ